MQGYQNRSRFQLCDFLVEDEEAASVLPRVPSSSSPSTLSSPTTCNDDTWWSEEDTRIADDQTPAPQTVPRTSLQGPAALIARARAFLEIIESSMSQGTKIYAIDSMLPLSDEEIQESFCAAGWSSDEMAQKRPWKQVSEELNTLIEESQVRCTIDTSNFPQTTCPKELLFPGKVETMKSMEEESVEGYLNFCKHNTLAEYWTMLKDPVSYDNKGAICSGWVAKNLKKFRVTVRGGEEIAGGAENLDTASKLTPCWLDVSPDAEKETLLELMGSCVIVNGRLGITSQLQCERVGGEHSALDCYEKRKRTASDKRARQKHCTQWWFDVTLGARIKDVFGADDADYDAKNKTCVYSFGNVRDFVLALNAVHSLRDHSTRADGSEAADCMCCTTRLCQAVVDASAREPSPLLPLTNIPDSVKLNHTQRACLEGLRYSLEAVQGPPGTGKTTFIHATVQSVSAQHPDTVTLVCCVQNQAVENLAQRFNTTTETLPFIVLGQESNERMGLCARNWTLDAQVARDEDVVWAKVWFEKCDREYEQMHGGQDEKSEEAREKRQHAWHSLQDAMEEARGAIVCNAQCVLATTTSSAQWRREATRAGFTPGVDCMVLDEAGNAADSQMPQLLLYNPKLLLLVGDHKQLPPFARGAGSPPPSLLERVVTTLEDTAPILTTQYRMHPRICKYVSSAFYGSRLVTESSVQERELNPETPGLYQGIVLDLYDRQRAGAEERLGTSYWNYTEVVKTMLALRRLVALLPASKTIAVISFYKAHVSQLKNYVEDVPSLQALVDSERLRILSVDSCQGSEADVVILNCVRSLNSHRQHHLKFLADKNRLCVATSRAKHLLLVIGCHTTLTQQGRFTEHMKSLSETNVRASTVGAWWQILTEKISVHRLKQRLRQRRLKQAKLKEELSAFF